MGIREVFGRKAPPVQDQHEAFRARAQERLAARAQARRRILVPLGSVAITAALVGVFLYTPVTAVGTIEVLGPVSEAQREQTQQHLSSLIGRQMIEVSTQEVNALAQQQQWVQATTASKQWPQTITVQVAVREPAIVIQSSTGEWAMDTQGFIIGMADPSLAHLPRVRTSDAITPTQATGSPGLVAAAQAVTVFPQTLKDYVTQWTVDPQVGLVVNMKPVGMGALESVQVIVGNAEEIPFKASTIEAMLEELAKTGGSSHKIDVRVPSRPVRIG